jgi:putative restriction endonuclease
VPLIYLFGIARGRYLPVWPVFIVGDAPESLTFTVAVDDQAHLRLAGVDRVGDPAEDGRRRYVTAVVRQRIHQRAFRERVLDAYRSICAVCRLRHRELLEAAHITPDADPAGEPLVSNGVSLCTIHHAAFDRQILGIRPDHVVEIRQDVLLEIDGPMLLHGLQEMHGTRILLPRNVRFHPDPDRLAVRYEQFRSA